MKRIIKLLKPYGRIVSHGQHHAQLHVKSGKINEVKKILRHHKFKVVDRFVQPNIITSIYSDGINIIIVVRRR